METHLLCSQTLAADMTKMGIVEATLNQFSKVEPKPTQAVLLLPWGQVNLAWKY